MGGISYNFKLSVVVPKKRTRKPDSLPSTVEKLVGVIMIDIDGRYYVRVRRKIETTNENDEVKISYELKDYELSQNSITCKGKEVVWRMDEKGFKFTQLIRNSLNLPQLHYIWKPFKPGVTVKGYINTTGKFEVLKVNYSAINDYEKDDISTKTTVVSDDDIRIAKEFYRENYKIIKEHYLINNKPKDDTTTE